MVGGHMRTVTLATGVCDLTRRAITLFVSLMQQGSMFRVCFYPVPEFELLLKHVARRRLPQAHGTTYYCMMQCSLYTIVPLACIISQIFARKRTTPSTTSPRPVIS